MKSTFITGLSLVLSVGLVAGCGGAAVDAAADDAGAGTGAQALTAAELDAALGGGARFVEVEVGSGLLATEVELEPDHAEERVEARVVAIDAAGTVVLDVEQLAVTFGDDTRFRTPEESRVDRAAWVAGVEEALAAGQPVFVRASRLAPASPQAPSDATFHATDLRIEDEVEETSIELLVGGEHIAASGDTATLTVLGRTVTIGAGTALWDDDVDDEAEGPEDEAEGPEDEAEGPEDDDGTETEDEGPEDDDGTETEDDGPEDGEDTEEDEVGADDGDAEEGDAG